MTQIIFTEIEGVLANAAHRSNHKHDCDNYAQMAENDVPNRNIIDTLNALSETYSIVAFSTGNERHRLLREDWLMQAGLICDELLLRRDGNFDREDDLRLSFVEGYFGTDTEALEKTALIFCNKESSIEMFRELGYCVLSSDWS